MDHHHNISPAQLQVLSLDKCVMTLSTETGLILFSFCCMSKLIRSQVYLRFGEVIMRLRFAQVLLSFWLSSLRAALATMGATHSGHGCNDCGRQKGQLIFFIVTVFC